ncbi:outer membrane protein [Pseudochrobactrum sp. HB0163]|uniref:outer membrane protein n=1 Tax=Pseudochrobactrum sp. HB0163 TaxID=3450708 RepID=UPI003F6E06D9
MKNKFLLLASVFIISNAGLAQAADVIYHPPSPPVYDEAAIWDGFYIGGQVGYTWAKAKLTVDSFDDTIGLKPRGFMGGIYAGYNWEFSNSYLFGIEGDINYSSLSDSAILTAANAQLEYTSRIELEGAVRARFGINYDRILPYIAGGVAFARIKDTATIINSNPVVTADDTDGRVGFTIGAGVDYAMTNNLILRAEYRYTDYGKKSFDQAFYNDSRNKLTTNDVRLGIAYKF